ncbi:MAG TPA: glutamate-1-semialdehyde 2,1-aminomutase [Herpetosiphonaceae bacterium]
MFPKSHQLSDQLRSLVPSGAHAFSKAADQWPACSPRMLSHGKGAWVWDIDGNRYVDWFTGLTTVSLGHAYPTVIERVAAQLAQGQNFQLPTALEYTAARTFLDTIALAEMVKFAKDGSTVNDAALRLARAYTGRSYVAKCRDQPFFSYGDWFIGKTRCNNGILPEAYQYTLEFPYNDLEYLERLFATYSEQIAAVIVEPVRFDRPQPGFLEGLRDLCTREGALLIFDEVVTGMKYHLNGAQAMFGVQPDLTTWGKGIANGFALSALTGPRAIMDLGDTTQHDGTRIFLLSSTHGGESSSLAAMIATVETFAAHDLIGQNYACGRQLREQGMTILAEYGIAEQVEFIGYDCFLAMKYRDAQGAESRAFRTLFFQELVKHGVLFRGIFYPTVSHRDTELDATLAAFRRAAETYRAALEQGVERYLVGPPIEPVL